MRSALYLLFGLLIVLLLSELREFDFGLKNCRMGDLVLIMAIQDHIKILPFFDSYFGGINWPRRESAFEHPVELTSN
jgi:hypothetical protein